jgi:hypothetical protein
MGVANFDVGMQLKYPKNEDASRLKYFRAIKFCFDFAISWQTRMSVNISMT